MSYHFKCKILVLDVHFYLQYRRRTCRGPRGLFSPSCVSLWLALCYIYRKPEEWSYRQTWPHSTRGTRRTLGQTETREINGIKWSQKLCLTTPSVWVNVTSIVTGILLLIFFNFKLFSHLKLCQYIFISINFS